MSVLGLLEMRMANVKMRSDLLTATPATVIGCALACAVTCPACIICMGQFDQGTT